MGQRRRRRRKRGQFVFDFSEKLRSKTVRGTKETKKASLKKDDEKHCCGSTCIHIATLAEIGMRGERRGGVTGPWVFHQTEEQASKRHSSSSSPPPPTSSSLGPPPPHPHLHIMRFLFPLPRPLLHCCLAGADMGVLCETPMH